MSHYSEELSEIVFSPRNQSNESRIDKNGRKPENLSSKLLRNNYVRKTKRLISFKEPKQITTN